MDKEQALKKIKELEEYVRQLENKSRAEQILGKYGRRIISKTGFFFANAFVSDCKKYIKVPLMSADKNWVFATFDYVKTICENEEYVYPVFYPDYDNSRFLYIKVC